MIQIQRVLECDYDCGPECANTQFGKVRGYTADDARGRATGWLHIPEGRNQRELDICPACRAPYAAMMAARVARVA
jgi:hypothetical protein